MLPMWEVLCTDESRLQSSRFQSAFTVTLNATREKMDRQEQCRTVRGAHDSDCVPRTRIHGGEGSSAGRWRNEGFRSAPRPHLSHQGYANSGPERFTCGGDVHRADCW